MELEVLIQLIVKVLNVDPSEIHEDTTFMGDLGADSLDLYQIVMGIEDTFDLRISADDVQDIQTVGQAVDLIRKTKEHNKKE